MTGRMKSSWTTALLVSLAATPLVAPKAMAQDAMSLEPLLDCGQISDDAERLACYDSIVTRLSNAGANMVAVDMEDVEAVERDGFGLELPSLPRLSLSLFSTQRELDLSEETEMAEAEPAPSDPAENRAAPVAPAPAEPEPSRVLERDEDGRIERIELAIADVRMRGFDTVFIDTENGQTWEITSGRNLQGLERRIRDGDVAVIRRAAVGSFLMQINGRGSAYRVIRRQ